MHTDHGYIVNENIAAEPPPFPWRCTAPVAIRVRATPERTPTNTLRTIPAHTPFSVTLSTVGAVVDDGGTAVWLWVGDGWIYGGIADLVTERA